MHRVRLSVQLHLDTNISAPKMNQFPQKLQEWDCIWGRGRSHGFAFFLFLTILFFPPSSFSASTFPFSRSPCYPQAAASFTPCPCPCARQGTPGTPVSPRRVTPLCHPLAQPGCRRTFPPQIFREPASLCRIISGKGSQPQSHRGWIFCWPPHNSEAVPVNVPRQPAALTPSASLRAQPLPSGTSTNTPSTAGTQTALTRIWERRRREVQANGQANWVGHK